MTKCGEMAKGVIYLDQISQVGSGCGKLTD